ncbi:hypothetical protein BGW39_002166 [Mortierella sp. 14UC]|nr:hypothetical protein BGW39_002166 [Mortierella sp. 14UC]
MNSYTIETVLDTREPGVIEIFGNAPGVFHRVDGVVHLHVDKTIHLKELSVVFLCVVGYNSEIISTSSDPMTIYKNHFDAIPTSSTPKEFLPGAYTFPFQIAIPSDLSTTDSAKLISQAFIWMYHLTTTAVPASITKGTTFSSLFQKRKTVHMPLVLRKVVIDPSGGNSFRCNAGRKAERAEDGEFRAVISVPQVVNVKQTIVPVTVQLKAVGGKERKKSKFWVKEIQAQAIQTEKIIHNSPEAFKAMEGLRLTIPTCIQSDPMATPKSIKKAAAAAAASTNTNTSSSATSPGTNNNTPQSMINTTHSKLISNLVTIANPNQFQPGVHTTPEEYTQTFELDLTAGEVKGNGGREVLPSETLPWVQISHAIKFKVVFEGENGWGGQKPLVVRAPLKVAFICERERINLVSGRPLLQAQQQQQVQQSEGDEWMFADSAPGYDDSAAVDGQAGGGAPGSGGAGGEDVLPGYGDDVGRANLLDSNVRGNNYGLQIK